MGYIFCFLSFLNISLTWKLVSYSKEDKKLENNIPYFVRGGPITN